MDAPAAVVWVAPQPADADQVRALTSWARARGVRLGPSDAPERRREAAVTPLPPLDPGLADDVETAIERARDAVAARDAAAADEALASADARLRAHPEWPQAAWLMAEVERVRAARWRKIAPVDPEAAARAWARAEALDGGRMAGVGEEPARDEAPAAHPADAYLVLDGRSADSAVVFDGSPVSSANLQTTAGLHAVVVTRAGRATWAEWIDSPPGRSTLLLGAASLPPCSPADVARAVLVGDGSVDAAAVACPRWAAATAGARPATLRIALCARGRCGGWLEWDASDASDEWARSPQSAPAKGHDRQARWPAWATWTLAGAGAAIATGVVLVAAGVFRSAPPETRFVNGGLHPQ